MVNQHAQLAQLLVRNLTDFQAVCQRHVAQIFAISVVVIGQLNRRQSGIARLGRQVIDIELQAVLHQTFHLPIILSEYFCFLGFCRIFFGWCDRR